MTEGLSRGYCISIIITNMFFGLSIAADNILSKIILLVLGFVWLINTYITGKRDLKMLDLEIDKLEKKLREMK